MATSTPASTHTLTFSSTTASLPFMVAMVVVVVVVESVVVVVVAALSSPQSHSGMLGSGEPGICFNGFG